MFHTQDRNCVVSYGLAVEVTGSISITLLEEAVPACPDPRGGDIASHLATVLLAEKRKKNSEIFNIYKVVQK